MNNISITFRKKIDLINSEGCIVGLYTINTDLWLCCLTKIRGTKILFSVSKDDLLDYSIGNINLFGLYNNSFSSDAFIIDNDGGHTLTNKFDFDYKNIELGNKFISQVPDSMSSGLLSWYSKNK